MKLLIYKIKLAFHLIIFLLKLSANISNKTKPIILGVFVLSLLIIISGITIINKEQKIQEKTIISNKVPKNKDLYNFKEINKEQLEDEIIYWETILDKQPDSRDILINLSNLYSALQNENLSQEYKNKAINIDPNNPLFK